MNKSYNIVWNPARSMYMVTSELARGSCRVHSQRWTAGLALGAIFSFMNTACATEIGPQTGASITLHDGDTVTSTTGGIGIASTTAGGSGVQINGKAVINITGTTDSTGIMLRNGTNNDLGTGTQINVTGTSPYYIESTGIYVNNDTTGADTNITASQLQINVSNGSGSAYGIDDSSYHNSVDLGTGSSVTVKTTSGYATGIATRGSTFSMDGGFVQVTSNTGYVTGVNIDAATPGLASGQPVTTPAITTLDNSRIKVSTSGSGAGLNVNGRGLVSGDHLTVNASGSGTINSVRLAGGVLDLGSGSYLTDDSLGETIRMSGGVLNADSLTLTTAQSTGLFASGAYESTVANIGEGSVIDGRNATGVTSGIRAAAVNGLTSLVNFKGTEQNRNAIYAVNGYGASAQLSGGIINLANTDITMTCNDNSSTYGLWAMAGGHITGENLNIDMTGTGKNGYGVAVSLGGSIDLSGNTTITTRSGGAAIWIPNGIVDGKEINSGTITGSGIMNITGGIINNGKGTIDLTMDAGSSFTGATAINAALGVDSVLNLTLADRSQWALRGASSLSTLDNAGTMTFARGSSLNANKLTLESSSELDVAPTALAQGPLITGGDITLAGTLNITGLDTLTSDVQQQQLQQVTLIDADTAIKGDFDNLSVSAAGVPDYLTVGGGVNTADNTKYDLGVGLSWYADGALTSSPAHGTFTLEAGKSFEVTQALIDVAAQPATGWDGKTLTKKGAGTLILSGDNTYSGGSVIEDGTLLATSLNALGSGDISNSGLLTLDAGGQFALSQNLTTHGGGTTQIATDSSLQVGTLTQESNSTLDVQIDLSSADPMITAQQANLDGALNISGISGEINRDGKTVTIIDADQDINGDFDTLTVAGTPAVQVDFLTIEGRVSRTDATQYNLTLGLSWYADSSNALAPAHGTFTLNNPDGSFKLGTALVDVAPSPTTGWDGKSLTKKGAGTLILTAKNTYSGTTDIQAGTLWLSSTGVIGAAGSQQAVNVAQGATFGGDNGTVNGNINNQGELRFNNLLTVNGNVTNSGSLVSGDRPGSTGPVSSTPGNTLLVNGNYTSTGGTLTLNTQLGDDNSPTDKLVVTGNTAGNTTLYINNAGGEGADTDQGIEVVDVGGQSDGTFTQGNRVQIGAYEYRLYDDGGDWYLRSKTDDNGDGGNDTPQYSPDTGAYLGNQWMARSLQMQTLYDREGSQFRTEDGNVWARFKAGKAESQAAGGGIDINNNYSQFQLGGAVAAWSDDVRSLTAGVMGSYINADTDSTASRGADGSQFSAKGNVDGYSLGLYATWFADAKNHRGAYIDSWYQYGIYNNSVDNGELGDTHYDSRASAVSLETGYRYDIALQNGNTISLTPQGQIIWQNYTADSVNNASDVHIRGQNGDSWNSRLGLRVDGKLPKDNGTIQPFVEANWLYTSDDTAAVFDNAKVAMELPSSRVELKAGIQANINKQWSITAQAAGQKGRDDYSDLNGSLNLRYSW